MKERHLIIGAGNLGLDLFIELSYQKAGLPIVASKSRGLDLTKSCSAVLDIIRSKKPDFVWYCVGGGSVQEAKDNPQHTYLLNTLVPIYLSENLPEETKLVVFSTDYSADENEPRNARKVNPDPRSLYAQQKIEMENTIKYSGRPNTAIVRVTSLYGLHKPEKTFPGKILRNFAFKGYEIKLPENFVTPTPTRWLAANLVKCRQNLFSETTCNRFHVAPQGNVSVRDWGKFVLNGIRADYDYVEEEFYDNERPLFSNLDCNLEGVLNYHWYQLFDSYYKPYAYIGEDLRKKLPKDLREPDRKPLLN